jgi:hypothetical protein
MLLPRRPGRAPHGLICQGESDAETVEEDAFFRACDEGTTHFCRAITSEVGDPTLYIWHTCYGKSCDWLCAAGGRASETLWDSLPFDLQDLVVRKVASSATLLRLRTLANLSSSFQVPYVYRMGSLIK